MPYEKEAERQQRDFSEGGRETTTNRKYVCGSHGTVRAEVRAEVTGGSGGRSLGGKLRRGVTLEFKINASKLTGSNNIFYSK